MRWAIMVVAFLLAGPVAGEPAWEPEDFAYGRELMTTGDAAVQRLRLPAAVYEGVMRPDLGDLRVFNANGEVVPFAIEAAADAETRVTERPLRFFPLTRARELEADSDLRGRRDASRAGQSGEPPERVYGYLVVVDEAARGALESLELAYTGDGQGVATTRIGVSDDLRQWRVIRRDVALAHLRYRGERLSVTRVPVAGVEARYLRITWPEALDDVRLDGVVGRFASKGGTPPRNWRDAGSLEETADGGLSVDAGGHFPVNALRLDAGTRNALARVTVSSRVDPDEPWRLRASGLYYDVRVEGTRLHRRIIGLERSVTDRHWRLTVEPPAVLDRGSTVELGWRPDELRFVAQGAGPFTLAWGHRKARPPEGLAGLVRSLADQAGDARAAELGDPVTLGGAEVLAPPREGIAWGRYTLWAVLIVAVVAVLGMARRLLREMGRDDS